MIVLFTDFGLEGPYVGQVKAVLWREAPGSPVIDLFADAPAQRPQEAAYLLAAYAPEFPEGSVFVCVVDPGVGSERPAVAAQVDDRWFVGPGNGLFELVLRRGRTVREYVIEESGRAKSASFHGRDIFAPVAGRLAAGCMPVAAGLRAGPVPRCAAWPDDLAGIAYVDHYGNAMTGIRAASLPPSAAFKVAGRRVERARTFSDVRPGEAFWYENANGLAELAVNRGRADVVLGLKIGDPVEVVA